MEIFSTSVYNIVFLIGRSLLLYLEYIVIASQMCIIQSIFRTTFAFSSPQTFTICPFIFNVSYENNKERKYKWDLSNIILPAAHFIGNCNTAIFDAVHVLFLYTIIICLSLTQILRYIEIVSLSSAPIRFSY